MKKLISFSLAILGFSCLIMGQAEVKGTIVSAGLFKNGIALITMEAKLPGNGSFYLSPIPEPLHATLWVEGDTGVTLRTTTMEKEVQVTDGSASMTGRKVTVFFRESGLSPISGRVVSSGTSPVQPSWSRDYSANSYLYSSHYPSPQSSVPSLPFILETDRGQVRIDPSVVAYTEISDPVRTVRRSIPVLEISASDEKKSPLPVRLHYLTRGLSWAPAYRVDVTDPKTLTIEQTAVIRNELSDLDNTELLLISGFPNISFGHVISPLVPSNSLSDFFNQLNRRITPGHAVTSNVMTQQIALPDTSSSGAFDPSAGLSGDGPDIHYQPAGKRSLRTGEALFLTTAIGRASYERIVEWTIPDTRRADGRTIEEYQRRDDPDAYQDSAWDALIFNNPLPFPMTTAPAAIIAGDRFLGQQVSTWVNPGDETTFHITKALSIKTRTTETEEEGTREVIYIGGDDFRRTSVKGTLILENRRNRDARVVIRRRFSGDLLEAEENPSITLREEGVWSVNKRNELTWDLVVPAGKSITLGYRYSVLVDV
ncbi:MAG TPA: hypothetical protein PK014_09460 [Thermoanaerobaculia bacterium]|mgnify:CR=1 FL=1|nr:hypothetical protein [Thermoanaerobaculia bacterium]HUM30413.1 hypothetical protein [Thermoanaerobaculia bacterium]HXK68576.1 hypothetical protein [Thermoanaerobaculia bacterium]